MPPRRPPVKAAAPDPWGPRYAKEDTVPTAEEIYPDFSDTVTHALEDTMRNLKVLSEEDFDERKGGRRPQRTAEYRGFELQALQNVTDELKDIRKAVARVIETQKTKASNRKFDEYSAELTKQVNARLDTIRNWAGVAIATIGMGLAIIQAFKH